MLSACEVYHKIEEKHVWEDVESYELNVVLQKGMLKS